MVTVTFQWVRSGIIGSEAADKVEAFISGRIGEATSGQEEVLFFTIWIDIKMHKKREIRFWSEETVSERTLRWNKAKLLHELAAVSSCSEIRGKLSLYQVL